MEKPQAGNTATTTSAYVPGVCNINTAEIAYRRKSAYVLLAITIVIAAPLLLLDVPQWARLILFLPVFLTVICALQVRNKFCVGYGAAGKQNAAEGSDSAQDVVEAAARKLDQQRTRTMKLQALAVATVVTALAVLIP